MELSKKRGGRGCQYCRQRHAAALASGRRHHPRTPSQRSRSDLLFRGSCKRIVPQKKNPQIIPDRQLCGDNKEGGEREGDPRMPGWLVTGPHTVRGKPCHSMALGHSSGAWQMFTLCPWVGDSCPGHSVDERWYPLSVCRWTVPLEFRILCPVPTSCPSPGLICRR